jgi:hypothetical protein
MFGSAKHTCERLITPVPVGFSIHVAPPFVVLYKTPDVPQAHPVRSSTNSTDLKLESVVVSCVGAQLCDRALNAARKPNITKRLKIIILLFIIVVPLLICEMKLSKLTPERSEVNSPLQYGKL